MTQKHATVLAVSDYGADEPECYGSIGWVVGTDQELL
jgi:hypothetical protein